MAVPESSSGNSNPALVAYRERDSYDPETGAPGVIRAEWQLRTVEAYGGPAALEAATGQTGWWTRAGTGDWVLERRNIKRGTVYPWELIEVGADWCAVLRHVDGPLATVTATDARMRAVQETVAAEQADEEREQHEKAAAEEQRQEKAEQQRASEAAFVRLLASKDGDTARAWNAFATGVPADDARRAQLRDDPTFRPLYWAVMNATTVPAKRKAIRAALAYAAPAAPAVQTDSLRRDDMLGAGWYRSTR